ncbi:MAG: hypothetical protein LUE89_02705 [Clostridiales bacterium]|nr:hypothetical protein [Clostridiales bacterium]
MKNNEFKDQIEQMRTRTGNLDREGTCWTEEERDTLAVMFLENCGISEMAYRFHRTEPAIVQQLNDMRLYQLRAGVGGMSFREKNYGCKCKNCVHFKDFKCRSDNNPCEFRKD